MKQLTSILLFCLLLLQLPAMATNLTYSGPIPSDALFTSSSISSLQLSPDGKIISFLEYDGVQRSLSFINTESNTKIKGIQYNANDYINNYYWLDNNTVYININISNKNRFYFASIPQTDESWLKKAPKITYKRHEVAGRIIGVLNSEKSELLYAQYNDEDFVEKLVVVKVADLINENLTKAKPVKNLLKDVDDYDYFKQSRRLVAIQIDKDDRTFTTKYRHFDDSQWQTMFFVDYEKQEQEAEEKKKNGSQTEEQEDLTFKIQGFMTGNKAAILTNYNSDKQVIYEYDLLKQEFTKLLYEHPKYDITSAVTNSNSDQLELVSYFDHGKLTIKYFDTVTAKEYQKLTHAFKDHQLVIVSKHTPSNTMIVRTSSPIDPGKYYYYDGKINQAMLLQEKYLTLKDYQFGTTESITVSIEQDIDIEAYLTQPIGPSHNTLLVMPHGGPIGIREYNTFNPEVQYYVSRGFSVLRVNFRGSAGFGKSFQQSGVGQFGQQIEQDITAAVKFIQNKYQFKKMCAMGASYGGYSSMMLAIKQPQDYDCVVASYGIFDLPFLYNASNIEVLEEYREAVSDVVGEYNDKLYDVSPVYLTEKINVPVLLIAGESDDIAHFEHSDRMLLMLETANKPVEHLFYRNTGHGHNHYWGDRHEAAYTVDYLMRILDLQPLWTDTDNTPELTKALIADYQILAQGYSSDRGIVRQDKQKAEYYSQLAIGLNDSETMFLRAQTILSDLPITSLTLYQDSKPALKLLKQASDAGNGKASAKLGRIYAQGRYAPKNKPLAYQYTKLGYKQLDKHAEINDFMFSRANLAWQTCLGYSGSKNLKQCLKLLSYEQAKQDNIQLSRGTKAILNRAITHILINDDGQLSPSEKQPFRELLSKQIEAKLEPLEVDVDKCYNKNIRITDKMVAEKDKLIAICFNIDASSFQGKLENKAAVLTRAYSTDKHNRFSVKDYYLMTSQNRKDWGFAYTFDQDDLIDADWTIEFYDILGNLIHQRKFTVTYEE